MKKQYVLVIWDQAGPPDVYGPYSEESSALQDAIEHFDGDFYAYTEAHARELIAIVELTDAGDC